MGDRAQIAVKQGNKKVYLYTHWGGSEIKTTLADALERGKGRWDDEEYLTRIIFSQMVKDDWESDTGFGIGLSRHGDIEHFIPIVDGKKQVVAWQAHRAGLDLPPTQTFAEFIFDHGTTK